MNLSRRSLLAGIGGTAAATSAPTAAESSGDWPTLQGNPGRRGRTSASLPTSTPSTRWEAKVGDKIYAGGSVSGDRAYVVSYDGELAALKLSDGTVEWRTEVPKGGYYPVTIAGDTLVLSTARDEQLLALRAGDGEPKWSYDRGHPNNASPAVHDETIFTVDGQELVARTVDTGSEQWRTNVRSNVEQPVAYASDSVVISTNLTELIAVDASSGTERWSVTTAAPAANAPTIVDGEVYAGIGSISGRILSVSLVDGTERWHTDLPAVPHGSVAVGENTVYVPVTAEEISEVYALDRDVGTVQWKHRIETSVFGSPLLADGHLYFGDSKGRCHCLGANSGEVQWVTTIDDNVGTIAPADGGLLVTTLNGTVYLLEEGTAIDSVPGFGPLPALGGLGGYALIKQLQSDDPE